MSLRTFLFGGPSPGKRIWYDSGILLPGVAEIRSWLFDNLALIAQHIAQQENGDLGFNYVPGHLPRGGRTASEIDRSFGDLYLDLVWFVRRRSRPTADFSLSRSR